MNSMKISRVDFLRQLEGVKAGLAQREKKETEQTSCFVFRDGNVFTYNEDVFCKAPSSLTNGLKGAVRAKKLLHQLINMSRDEELEMEQKEEEIVFHGERRGFKIPLEKEVLLPVDEVEIPTEWSPLPENFTEALKMVERCAAKDDKDFKLSCIHLHPKYIEACDGYQVGRYLLKWDLEERTLVKREFLKEIINLDMVEFSKDETWFHMRNRHGQIFSCKCYLHEYPNLKEWLKVEEGTEITLPKGMEEECNRLGDLSDDEVSVGKMIEVKIHKNKVTFEGSGVLGRAWGEGDTEYKGPPVRFFIPSKILAWLSDNHNTVLFGNNKLRVTSGPFRYVTPVAIVE